MNDIKISLIIPVYNTGREYVIRCFESIKKQAFHGCQVIVVDDGSKEECRNYVEKLCDEYGFEFLRQENKGVCAARNLGLDCCKGEYVMFADSDDSLEEGVLARAYDIICKANADVVLGGINIVHPNSVQHCGVRENVRYTGEDIGKLQRYMLAINCEEDNRELKGLRCTGPWAKLIKRDIIKDIRFNVNLPIYEDLIYNLFLLDRAKTVEIDSEIWYNYFYMEGSAMNKYRPDGIREMNCVIGELSRFKKDHGEVFGSAAALAGVRCVCKILSHTVFHEENKEGAPLKTVKKILNEPEVRFVLSDFDAKAFPYLSWKVKLKAAACRKKMYRLLFCLRRFLH